MSRQVHNFAVWLDQLGAGGGSEAPSATSRRDAARDIAKMSRAAFLALPESGEPLATALVQCWQQAVAEIEKSPRDARIASELKALATALAVATPDRLTEMVRDAVAKSDAWISAGLPVSTRDALTKEFDKALVIARREAAPKIQRSGANEVALVRAVDVALFCRAGLEELILEPLRKMRLNARQAGKGLVLVHFGDDAGSSGKSPFASLQSIRFWHDAGFVFPFPPSSSLDDLAALIARRLAPLLAPFGARVRFDWQASRSVNWDMAGKLEKLGSRLVNAPREADWDLMIDTTAGRIVARPKSWFDQRFAWRVGNVPASSHAPLAAALARIASPMAGEVVWDPFCGAGTELIEAALLQPAARLLGSDLDPAAVEVAKANAGRALAPDVAMRIDWRAGDFRNVLAPETVDVILTNPPLGRRVAAGEALALADELIYISAKRLRPGTGRLVWVAPDAGHVAVTARQAGLKVARTMRVDLGGFDGEVQVLVPASDDGRA